MSASNYNWVCFRCRVTTRQAKTARTVPKCAGCGLGLYCPAYKVEVPRKLDVRGWRKLHSDSRRRVLACSDARAVKRVRFVHAAERELARLRSLGPAKGRQKVITKLEQKLRESGSPLPSGA